MSLILELHHFKVTGPIRYPNGATPAWIDLRVEKNPECPKQAQSPMFHWVGRHPIDDLYIVNVARSPETLVGVAPRQVAAFFEAGKMPAPADRPDGGVPGRDFTIILPSHGRNAWWNWSEARDDQNRLVYPSLSVPPESEQYFPEIYRRLIGTNDDRDFSARLSATLA